MQAASLLCKGAKANMQRIFLGLFIAIILVTAASSEADAPDVPQEPEERVPTASDAYTFDSPVRDMKWVKDEKGKPTVVLLQTTTGNVHKSVDGGRNWQSLSDLFKPTVVVAPPPSPFWFNDKKTPGKDHLIQKMSAQAKPIFFQCAHCFFVLLFCPSLMFTAWLLGTCQRSTVPSDFSSPSPEQCTSLPTALHRSPQNQLSA